MSDWMATYDAACAELKEAEAHHRHANSIYCAAVARLERAKREVGRLYKKRIEMINSDGQSENR